MSTHHVRSSDGVLLSCETSGDGPSLVLVHGTGGGSARWTPVLHALASHFTVYAMDRRGRGKSGDAPTYAMEREFEDVAAVVDSAGPGVHLLGHSYGAICCLEAARLTTNIRKLVLYEPPIPSSTPTYSDGVIERIEDFAAQENREEVIKTFVLEVLRAPQAEFEAMRNSPAWPDRLAAAHTLPRELRAHERYRFNAERFGQMGIPTLLLLGGDSSEFFRIGTHLLHEALSGSRIVVLPGQRHTAMNTAPELFAREAVAFLEE